jgi:hypothetical protein
MTQANPDEPTFAEGAQPSDQIHAAQVEPTIAQPAVEPAMDDAADNVVEPETDAEDTFFARGDDGNRTLCAK